MLTVKSLQLKNFLSVGNVQQTIDFDTGELTLILGENLDLGGNDSGSRNGVGKTCMLQGLSYALFGSAINTIKKDNLINRTNEKNMLVTVEFSVRGIDYKIVRGRKPNVLKFYINNTEQATTDDDSQGDSRQTQEAIERVLCMSSTMFQHIVGLNSYTTPFLSMKVSDQREVIEQLLGITLLSEKAEAIKELNKKTKEEIQSEEYRIRGVDGANRRIQEQIDNLTRRQSLWLKKYETDLNNLALEYGKLIEIDIESELQLHKDLAVYNQQLKKKEIFDNLVAKQVLWRGKQAKDVQTLKSEYDSLNAIDIQVELSSHIALVAYNEAVRLSNERDTKLSSLRKDLTKEQKNWAKLDTEVKTLSNHRCYACQQEFHDDSHALVLSKKLEALGESKSALDDLNSQIAILDANTIFVSTKPTTHYKTEAEAIRHNSMLENLSSKIESKLAEVDPYIDQLLEVEAVLEVGTAPKTYYETEIEAIEHRSRVASLEQQITIKSQETDPYLEQIEDMSKSGLQEINYSTIDSLNKMLKHQDYLLDLLTNKKSFVRKKIIEQNLGYLNSRLTTYLDKIGLPHRVVFQNDLSVEITELGRDLDFDSLSRGERNRVILGLSFAFRDVFENLFMSANLVFIDELMDSGMDAAGMENGLAILKDMVRKRNKSVWLVSHKDELASRVGSILKVVKSGGFTEFQTDIDM